MSHSSRFSESRALLKGDEDFMTLLVHRLLDSGLRPSLEEEQQIPLYLPREKKQSVEKYRGAATTGTSTIFIIASSITLSLFFAAGCSSKPDIPALSKVHAEQNGKGDGGKEGIAVDFNGPLTAEKLRNLYIAINKDGSLDRLRPFAAERNSADHLARLYNLAFSDPKTASSIVHLLDKLETGEGLDLSLSILSAFLESGIGEGSPALLRSLLSENKHLFDLFKEITASSSMHVIAPILRDAANTHPEKFRSFAGQIGEFLTTLDAETGESGAKRIVNLATEIDALDSNHFYLQARLRGSEDLYQIAHRNGFRAILEVFHQLSLKGGDEVEQLRRELLDLLHTRSFSQFVDESQANTPEHLAATHEHPGNDFSALTKLAITLSRPLDKLLSSLNDFLDTMRGFLAGPLHPDSPAYRAIERYAFTIDLLYQEVTQSEFHALAIEQKFERIKREAFGVSSQERDLAPEDNDHGGDDKEGLRNLMHYYEGAQIEQKQNAIIDIDLREIYEKTLQEYLEDGYEPAEARTQTIKKIKKTPKFKELERKFIENDLPQLSAKHQEEMLDFAAEVLARVNAESPLNDNLYGLYFAFSEGESLAVDLAQDIGTLRNERPSPVKKIVAPLIFSHIPSLFQYNEPLDQFLRTSHDRNANPLNETWLRYAITDRTRKETQDEEDNALITTLLESYQAIGGLIQRGSYDHLTLVAAEFAAALSSGGNNSLPHLFNTLRLLHSGKLHNPKWEDERKEPINLISPLLKKWMSGDLGKSLFSLAATSGQMGVGENLSRIMEELLIDHSKRKALEKLGEKCAPRECRQLRREIQSLGDGKSALADLRAHIIEKLGDEGSREILSHLEAFESALKGGKTSRSLLNAWGVFKKIAKDYPVETENLLLALGEYLSSGENVTSLIRTINLYARVLAETHPTIEWWSVANQLAERDVFSHLSEVILSVLERKDEFKAYRDGYQLFRELIRTGALADSLKLFAKYAKASHKVTRGNQ